MTTANGQPAIPSTGSDLFSDSPLARALPGIVSGFKGLWGAVSKGSLDPNAQRYTPTPAAAAPAPNMDTNSGPVYGGAPSSPAPAKPSLQGATLEQLRASNQAKRAAAASAAAKPAVPAVGSHVTTPSGVVVNPATGGVVSPPAPNPAIAPGLPGGPDPAQAGFGNQNPANTQSPTPPAPTAPPPGSPPPGSPPPVVPLTPTQQAEADYQANLVPTADEAAAQKAEDDLTASYNAGVNKVEGQAIPMPFITGQEARLKHEYDASRAGLEATLTRLQAKRTAALDASKFALDRADKQAADASSSMTVAPGSTVGKYDKATGAFTPTYTAPETAKAESAASRYGTGPVGEYSFYADQERAAGRTPMSFNDYQTYDANRKAAASAGAVGNDPATGLPNSIMPYLNTTDSGGRYVDLSAVDAKDRAALTQAAYQAGVRVVSDKNAAADLANIQNAYRNLDTVNAVLDGISQPGALSRALYGAGLTKAAELAQTDPQKAASQVLNDIALDIFKSLSGVQGFRGNTAAINQVKESMPTMYDTADTVAKKLAIIRQLIGNREDALLGSPASPGSGDAAQGGFHW